MVQNRNKIISLFVGNATNIVVHRLLGKVTLDKEVVNRYLKEEMNSLEIAKKYREKINPTTIPLPGKDIDYIKNKLIQKATSKLEARILKKYENIDLEMINELVDEVLREMNIV